MMDGSYKQMAMRVSWRLTRSSHADSDRDHERDFEDFAEHVVSKLRSSSRVTWTSTGGEPDEYRDITFNSDRPVAQADWAEAVGSAAATCCVLSDQKNWAFE